jgi:undecaprenyl-diphosphatase
VPADRTGFAAGLHAGSTVGLAVALRDDLRRLPPPRVRRLVLSAVPAAAVGALAHGVVERKLGRPAATAALLAGSGVLLALADRSTGERLPDDADVAMASLAQTTALVPGVSRAGATLTALRARGVDREAAVRLSLLMSLPVTAGAAALTAVRARQAPPLVPTAMAGLGAYAAARRLHPTRGWVVGSVLYRLGVSAAVAVRLRRERA